MNRIKYILDLTNISLPDEVRAETEQKIRTAKERTAKNKSKKNVFAVICAAVVFAALAVAFAVIIKNAGTKPETPDTDTETYKSADYAETDEPFDATENGYYVFDRPYFFDIYYDIFRTTVRLIRPCEDSLVVSDDLKQLSGYFGEADPSADELCETLFAFYEPGCVKYLKGITNYSSTEMQSVKEELIFIKNQKDGLLYNEIILLTAKNGTFEYVLTLPVFADKEFNDYSQKVCLYDKDGKQIGSSGTNGYKIEKTYLQSAQTNIYKIRVESGLPVIYAKYTVDAGKFQKDESADISSPFGIGIRTKVRYNGDETVESGRFRAGSAIIEFRCEENYILEPVFSRKTAFLSSSSDLDSASFCDYPYSFPDYDKNSNLCSRKTVCDVINEFGLQWFFPMYVTEENGVVRILGEGIVTGERVYSGEYLYSSVMLPVFGTGYENGIYTSYYNVNGKQSPIGLCYLPATCDKPYFDESYFNSDHSFMIVTVKDGKIGQYFYADDPTSSSVIPYAADDQAEAYMGKPVDYKTFEPKFTTDYPYIKDCNDTYFPARPFDIKYLPLLADCPTDTPKLFERLGVSVPRYERLNVNMSDLTLGHREINVIYYEVIYYEEKDGADADLKEYRIKAFEEINGYLIDMSGCVCGKAGEAGEYLFTTVDPNFYITVKARNGEAVYMSYSGDLSAVCADNMILGTAVKADDGSDTTSFGIRVDTLLHFLYKAGVEDPVIDIIDDGFDDQLKAYIIKFDVMNLPFYVMGLRSGDKRVYTYYSNAERIIENGRVYWECQSDDYVHGYFRMDVLYDGYELNWYTETEDEYDE